MTAKPSATEASALPNESNQSSSQDFADCKMNYPLRGLQRESYRTKAGKPVTEKQWAIYDFVRTIPCGKVTTYKYVCDALGSGSPRSVGSALRNNPFAPYVPCHRVIASDLFIGGFFGEWGKDRKGTKKSTGVKGGGQCQRKLEMLTQEGVLFTKNGYLLDGEKSVWRG